MDSEGPPQWLEQLLEKQTASLSSALATQIKDILRPDETQDPPPKRPRPDEGSLPRSPTRSHPPLDDSVDDFDKKFGHLIGLSVNDSPPGDDASEGGYSSDASVDDDLVVVLDKVPNWDTGSSIRSFIKNTIDNPLPDEMIKQLNEDYVPAEAIQDYFSAPKMPSRLYTAISRLKSKGALKTERALYAAQTELFVVAKPLLAALIELRPLGSSVKKARELMSVSLHGMYSVSLRISKARRENVRFLFKEALAEALYAYAPTHSQLFGGSSFSSQVEKAAKEAKVDLSWSKPGSSKRQSFRTSGSQGFQYSGGAGKYFSRQSRGRRNSYGSRKTNYNAKSGSQKSKGGSTRQNQE